MTSNHSRIITAYEQAQAQIKDQLAQLGQLLSTHRETALSADLNWAHVDDLNHVRENVQETINFLKGEEN